MKILIAENSGFCFGVSKAIDTTTKVISESEDTVFSYGPLIHNEQETLRLEGLGLRVLDDIEKGKGSRVIIRSHGVPLDIYTLAEKNNVKIIDSTCPFVRKIQEKAKEFYEKEYQVVIIGNPQHPEVIGINGWCKNSAIIINSKDDIENMTKYDKICIVAQTTLTQESFEELSKLIIEEGGKSE